MKYANLHLHSNHSDAMFTPEQLVLIGKSLGYRALALTDHETDSGVKPIMDYAKLEGGMDIISGVEFYGSFEGHIIHITALNYDLDNPVIRAFIKERVELRCEKTRKLVEYGTSIGVIDGVTYDDVVRYNPDGAWLCIDSVLNAYKAKKLLPPQNIRQAVFRSEYVKSIETAVPDAAEVIQVIRAADGVAVLAHPGWHDSSNVDLIPGLVELGLNGVEVSHPDNHGISSARAREFAKTYNLYVSGGTDHTGAMSGCGGRNAIPALQGITEEEYYILKERRLG